MVNKADVQSHAVPQVKERESEGWRDGRDLSMGDDEADACILAYVIVQLQWGDVGRQKRLSEISDAWPMDTLIVLETF